MSRRGCRRGCRRTHREWPVTGPPPCRVGGPWAACRPPAGGERGTPGEARAPAESTAVRHRSERELRLLPPPGSGVVYSAVTAGPALKHFLMADSVLTTGCQEGIYHHCPVTDEGTRAQRGHLPRATLRVGEQGPGPGRRLRASPQGSATSPSVPTVPPPHAALGGDATQRRTPPPLPTAALQLFRGDALMAPPSPSTLSPHLPALSSK